MTSNKTRRAWILYYSDTGNTRNVADEAEKTLKQMGWEVFASPLRLSGVKYPEERPDFVLLGTPVHMWAIPESALPMLRQLPRMDGAFGFTFCTYGHVFQNDVAWRLAMKLREKGVTVLGGAALCAPHNFMDCWTGKRLGDVYAEFGKGNPDGHALGEFRQAVAETARRIEAGETKGFDTDVMQSPIPWLTRMDGRIPMKLKLRFLAPVVLNEKKCTGCGNCVTHCATGSIRNGSRGGIEIEAGRCVKCYACIHVCAAVALSTDWRKLERLVRTARKLVRDPGPRIVY